MVDDAFTACAEQLAHNPELVRRLLVVHSADEDSRCRAHHGNREPHPCSIRSLAEMAVRLAGPSDAGSPCTVPERGAQPVRPGPRVLSLAEHPPA